MITYAAWPRWWSRASNPVLGFENMLPVSRMMVEITNLSHDEVSCAKLSRSDKCWMNSRYRGHDQSLGPWRWSLILPLPELVEMLPANRMIIDEIMTRDHYSSIKAKMIILFVREPYDHPISRLGARWLSAVESQKIAHPSRPQNDSP